MDYKLLMNTAVLAGEIMLKSGAETYRVEDTMNHILHLASLHSAESFVVSTGIIATLSGGENKPITVVKRVNERETNLNRVYRVNSISRDLCEGRISLQDAWDQLNETQKQLQYCPWMVNIAMVGITASFTLLLGGNGWDVFGAAVVGALLAAFMYAAGRAELNSILKTTAAALAVAVGTLALRQFIWPALNTDLVIIGCIMPLVPGMAFTNALRDILYGDYTSGCARIMEAILIAAAVAVGVGCGISLFHWLGGVM